MKPDIDKSQKAEILYRLLCMNREASARYLNDAGRVSKIEDPGKRKEAFNVLLKNHVNSIEQSRKK
jgi:hypothetical protein